MIKITSRGVPELQAWLKSLNQQVKDEATRAVAEYLVGDQTHGLKHYVPYKHVTIQQAGGWKSDRQRRYVMAMIRQGKIDPGYPHRTGEMQRAWKYKAQGSRYEITNDSGYAQYVMGSQQSTMHNLIGWRQIPEVIKNNLAGAFKHANAAIRKWIAAHKR